MGENGQAVSRAQLTSVLDQLPPAMTEGVKWNEAEQVKVQCVAKID